MEVHRIPGNFTIEQKGNKDLSYDSQEMWVKINDL
jgi:hypothetical protein